MGVEIFEKLTAPSQLNRETLSALSPSEYERLSFGELERLKLEKIVQVLDHPELQKLIEAHKITLALIKPHADENAKGYGDEAAARAITAEIRHPLTPVFSVSVRLNLLDAEDFYINQKGMLSKQPAARNKAFGSKWQEHLDFMSSGPTTFLLLYSEQGDAIKEWRKQIGHWDVEGRKRDYHTIRGRWAKSNLTSIVHGSDSPETAKREIRVLRNHLAGLASRI